jgi:calcium/calmodulin-dependent protein kinase I
MCFQKEIGSGRFSKVYEATNKATGAVVAVKLITKADLKEVNPVTFFPQVLGCHLMACLLQNERELLRTEIAVLKLVKHPHIVRLEDVFETPQTIYIVMERVKGGELFHRIVGRPRFTEPEARALVIPLLQAVAYIHGMGIIHRDIKPENILCGNSLTDIKLADFGLSKLVTPQEIMKMACGTLSYVAPEVLTMKGYGKEADLWSVGVILYLM